MSQRNIKDTTNFFFIDYGDVIDLGVRQFKVTGHERESRFGMDEPKYWVKKAIDLKTGEKKILKLSYFESFETSIGGVKINRFRNPKKEGDILALVGSHPYFMHGKAYRDIKDNNIRVLDIVHGINFYNYIASLEMDYNTYFKTLLPEIIQRLINAFEAIRFLHVNGFNHGDIRNDHIIIERETGNYVWIDFDYDYQTSENPFGLDLFGIGNILIYAVGMGFHNLYNIKNDKKTYKNIINDLDPGDFAILDQSRFINLRRLYPIIPLVLNDILTHFSRRANIYYELVEELIDDLYRCLYLGFG